MHAQTPGEKTITIGVMDDHAGAAAGGTERARHDLRPHLDVGPGVSDDDRLAGGAGGSVDADQFFAGHREHVERIVVAQIDFGREREFGEIGKLFKVGRMDARFVENFFVMCDVVVGMRERPGQAPGLQRCDVVAGGALGVIHLGDIAARSGLSVGRGHCAFP